LALDHRQGATDAGDLGQALGQLGEVGEGRSIGATKTWPLIPTILSESSLRKPFITDSTTISVATPS
jgi:hypothetical protein